MEQKIENILKKRKLSFSKEEKRYDALGLKSNPFPKSGTANINESEELTKKLIPIDSEVYKKTVQYIADSLYPQNENDNTLIGTILGDYGTGKTQLLLLVKYIIQRESSKAYVIYINNPGSKLSELIGAIIDNIGKEQFKKFLWNQAIDKLSDENKNYRDELLKFTADKVGKLFHHVNIPFSIESKENHKAFIDSFINNISLRNKRKQFNEYLKKCIIIIFEEKYNDSVIANYFYNIISEDFGVSKTWETMTSGDGRYLDKKVVPLLNAIIQIIKDQGFDRFYLLVDEFEDITSGRLTKKEVDNYSHNLRTLIDKERRWCVLIAMTRQALQELKKSSPPLVDRLTNREIILERPNDEAMFTLILNYLNLVRRKSKSIHPFNEESLKYLNTISNNSPRLILRNCFFLIERAAEEELSEKQEIDKKFIRKHLKE